MVVIGQKWLYLGKSGCIREKSGSLRGKVVLFGKMVVFGQSCCIWAKVFLIRQNLLYSGKCGSNRAKVVLFE